MYIKPTPARADDEILGLIHSGSNFGTARTLIRKALKSSEGKAKLRRRALLDLLVLLEVSANRRKAAIAALAERQTLGFRGLFLAFDASLLKASLLMQTGQYSAAKDEVGPLLKDRRAVRYPSLLNALELYVHDDQSCDRGMQDVLVRCLESVIKRFGIPVQSVISGRNVRELVREAHATFRAANKRHIAVALQALEARSPEARVAAIQTLEAAISDETVKYFRRAAHRIIGRLRGT